MDEAQRRARALLRAHLSPSQRAMLARRGFIPVRGNAGGHYRLWPATGTVESVERHGRYWYRRCSWCFHEEREDEPLPAPPSPGSPLSERVAWEQAIARRGLPPADVSLAQLFILTTDETGFLEEANPWGESQMWDGRWLRTLHVAREARGRLARFQGFICTVADVEA